MTDEMNTEELKENLKSRNTWIRLLYMVLFALIYSVAEVVITAVVLFQFLHSLVTGRSNANARRFGESLSTFVYQILRFLTYNTEELPFPFAEWPQTGPAGGKAGATTRRKTATKKAPSRNSASSATQKKPDEQG